MAAIDVKQNKNNSNWTVYTHGGRNSTEIDAFQWAKELCDRGAGEILLTSMDRDGTKKGFDLDLLNLISSEVSIPVIASGGAPPDAITGIDTSLEIRFNKSKSKPFLVPSLSILVKSISPAPLSHSSLAHWKASISVEFRPP